MHQRLREAALTALVLALATSAWAQAKAYVANITANTVTVIDTSTRAVVATIPVAGANHIAVGTGGDRVYVPNRALNTLTVIDGPTNAVVATIPTGIAPTTVAVSPDGQRVFVGLADGTVDVVDPVTRLVVASLPVGGLGEIAVTPDGSRAYVAAPTLAVIDVATLTVTTTAINTRGTLAVRPDGSSVYVSVPGPDIFGGDGVGVVDTASNTLSSTIWFGSTIGNIAFTPDGSRAYVGMGWRFVDTGYGAGFFPGRTVSVIDAVSQTAVTQIDLGADGSAWTQQNLAGKIAVTPDRSDVYIVVPRLGAVAIAPVNTNVVAQRVVIGAGMGGVGIGPDPSTPVIPYVVSAVDDVAGLTSGGGGTAVANVLANDTLGGVRATLSNVALSQLSTSQDGVSLTPGGAVQVAPGTPVDTYTLTYRICELASALNCDDATVTVPVRAPYLIDAVDDATTSVPGRSTILNVLANDTLNGVAATTASVTLSVLASDPGVTLNPTNGWVSVSITSPLGPQTITYRICEKASPASCDQATATVIVIALVVNAVDDTGTANRVGGTAVANVLANDTLGGVTATLANVTLALVSSSNAGITLNTATGAVTVASGTAAGVHTLTYQICEKNRPTNCDPATVTVTVAPYVVDVVDDFARASSKVPGTAIASVLANDWFAGARATTATVTLTQVTAPPSGVKFNTTTGAVNVVKKTSSGLYTFIYKACEKGVPTNCDQATVTLDLTGSGTP